jgi:hypothetical protein
MKFPRALLMSFFVGATLSASISAAALTHPLAGQVKPLHPYLVYKPASLVLPQSNAFAILGHSCGGISVHPY